LDLFTRTFDTVGVLFSFLVYFYSSLIGHISAYSRSKSLPLVFLSHSVCSRLSSLVPSNITFQFLLTRTRWPDFFVFIKNLKFHCLFQISWPVSVLIGSLFVFLLCNSLPVPGPNILPLI